MIIGVGIDIVDVRRIDALFQKFGAHFLNRIYTDQEIAFWCARNSVANSLAKMYALKEATIKALSDAKGIKWHDMEICHDLNGKPEVKLRGVALENIQKKAKTFSIQASASDEQIYAIAYVLIEGV